MAELVFKTSNKCSSACCAAQLHVVHTSTLLLAICFFQCSFFWDVNSSCLNCSYAP